MMRISGTLFALVTLVIALSACESGSNPPPASFGKWTWVSGSNVIEQAGSYGTQGTADPSNVPGAREAAGSWIDSAGKLWLFGGLGYDSAGLYADLNDLWVFDPITFEWTWVSGNNIGDQWGSYGVQGMADPSNVPGARDAGSLSWIDSGGNFWLFGGYGYDSAGLRGYLNDLWKFDPTTLEWTWVSGSNTADQAGIYGTRGVADPSNSPGGRQSAVSWIDSSGKLWLFGGGGADSTGGNGAFLNDLWKFDPTTLEWTWVSGSDLNSQGGVYGIQGVADPSNVPEARAFAVSWIDSQDKLWLFGGHGFSSGPLNDLWKYDPTTLLWTWVSGSNMGYQPGIYGTKGTPDPKNVPAGRESAISWLDSEGEFWLFGGYGWTSTIDRGWLNDLWKYDPTTLEWTWVSGSNTPNQAGIYGTKGRAASSNIPGARLLSVSWIDSQDKLWLFGGTGIVPGDYGRLNDLWQYTR